MPGHLSKVAPLLPSSWHHHNNNNNNNNTNERTNERMNEQTNEQTTNTEISSFIVTFTVLYITSTAKTRDTQSKPNAEYFENFRVLKFT